jgi:mycofactocin system glycosyltransferase
MRQPRTIAWDDRARLWGDGSAVLGGAPWGLFRIAPAGRPFVRRLRDAGPPGLTPESGVEQAVADLLLARGVAHPVVGAASPAATGTGVDIVVPCYQRPELLDACLTSLRTTAPEARIIVVDDASPSPRVGEVARAHGATVLRHEVNRGPAAARNTAVREVNSPIVAFIDADCSATPGWLATLVAHFDDPRLAAVAPRIRPATSRHTLLSRYEVAHSALDMGPRPEVVKPGAPLGFLPSAALAVRVSDLPLFDEGPPFDEGLRVGEDVDLVWRLVDAGALVRYEPNAVVTHQIRPTARGWAGQIFGYGTSAAQLDRRHPGRLTPARLSVWNIAAAVLLLGLPRRRAGGVAAAATIAAAAASQARTLRAASVDPRVAAVIAGKGLISDAASVGRLLRREWWPVGWLALTVAPRSRVAGAAVAAMLVGPVREWLTRRPTVDLPRYLLLRLLEDAAYGSGVIAGAVRWRRPGVLVPQVRRTSNPKKPKRRITV